LRQLIWSDSVEKVHFVNVLHCLFDGDWIEQITYDHLNPRQGFLVGFAHENPHVGIALFQLFDDFGTNWPVPPMTNIFIRDFLQINVAGDAAPTRPAISVGGRLDHLTIEISAQEFGARAYTGTSFRHSMLRSCARLPPYFGNEYAGGS
jgi:hypothetical protein